MDESIVRTVLICVAIVFLAAVIGILATGAISAKEIANVGTSFFDKAIHNQHINTYELSDSSKPIAAIAAVLRYEKEKISRFNCEICGATSAANDIGSCLANHLTGRGVLAFTENTVGSYDVVLSGG